MTKRAGYGVGAIVFSWLDSQIAVMLHGRVFMCRRVIRCTNAGMRRNGSAYGQSDRYEASRDLL